MFQEIKKYIEYMFNKTFSPDSIILQFKQLIFGSIEGYSISFKDLKINERNAFIVEKHNDFYFEIKKVTYGKSLNCSIFSVAKFDENLNSYDSLAHFKTKIRRDKIEKLLLNA